MSTARILKLISGILEAVLAIPLLGGAIVIWNGYTPLFFMLVLHIVTLVLSYNQRSSIYGSVVGIITSLIAWIPIIGWFMHGISAVLLLISARKE